MSFLVSYPLSISVSLSREIYKIISLCDNVPDVCYTVFIRSMSMLANVTVGAGGVSLYSPLSSVDEYILRHISAFDARWFVVMPVGQTLTARVDNEESKTDYAGWRRR